MKSLSKSFEWARCMVQMYEVLHALLFVVRALRFVTWFILSLAYGQCTNSLPAARTLLSSDIEGDFETLTCQRRSKT
jgi:hypothetical protein